MERRAKSSGIVAVVLAGLLAASGCATAPAHHKLGASGLGPTGGGSGLTPKNGGSSGGAGTVTSVSGTAPIAIATGTTTPVVSITAATTSAAGSLSAADKAFIDGSAWERSARAFMLSKIPQLTGFKEIIVGGQPIGAANATPTGDPLAEGGGVGNTAGAVRALTGMVFQTPKTGKLAIYGRVKLPVPVTGKQTMFGAINAAGTHQFIVMSSYDTTTDTPVSQAHTNYVFQIAAASNFNSATTAAVDGNYHDICITMDGTNYQAYIDQGSQIISDSAKYVATNISSDEPYQIMVFGTDAIAAKVVGLMYGYVAP